MRVVRLDRQRPGTCTSARTPRGATVGRRRGVGELRPLLTLNFFDQTVSADVSQRDQQ